MHVNESASPGQPAVTRLGLWVDSFAAVPVGGGLLERAAAVAGAAERAGFDAVFVGEVPGRSTRGLPPDSGGRPVPDGDAYEAYSLLGALAARSRSLRLGAVPPGGERRAPAMLAKIVTAVDVISHGRAVLTLGWDAGPGGQEADRLGERLQVCRAVLEDETPRFTGRFYEVDGALNRPAPVQPGGVPIVVFAGPGVPVHPDLLRAAGHFADAVVVEGGAANVVEAVALVGEAAGSVGRAPGSVQVIWKGRPDRPADEVPARLAAGADGCIVSPADAGRAGGDRLEAIARLGSVLRGAVDSVPARAGTRCS